MKDIVIESAVPPMRHVIARGLLRLNGLVGVAELYDQGVGVHYEGAFHVT